MTTFRPDLSNQKFELAIRLVNQTNRNIFLTGKAGTGKTTFLKYIRENCPKQMAVLAPTGVAAINAGGVTIHSFFQLPISPFIPQPSGFQSNGTLQNNSHTLLRGLKYNHEKRKLLQQLELLIIDEISMVRADLLDAIDLILRHSRHRYQEKFGGVQMLFIGDMFQLPPVVTDHEWQLLSSYYAGPFFFQSHALKDSPPLFVAFDKIYRQNEETFLHLLNQVRDNKLDEEGMVMLEDRFSPQFNPDPGEGYIILTTHNQKASEINFKNLSVINNPAFNYEAEIKEDFPDRSYPAELSLSLKVGAQVMFIRNDSSERGKRYFNGKIGIVCALEPNKIFVRCKKEQGGEEEIEVHKETWENIRYKLEKSTGNLDSQVLGSFTQFPLRLAWAITIHKSQGLTFEKAIIDAGQAFAPGQVYVALSRCTTLSGLVLKSRIQKTGLFTDPMILEFSKQTQPAESLSSELENSRLSYLETILLKSFDFSVIVKIAEEVSTYLNENASSFRNDPLTWINPVTAELKKLQRTAISFQSEIRTIFSSPDTTTLQSRISAGATYFINESGKLIDEIKKSPLVTDSWTHSKEVNEQLKYLFEQLTRKQYLLEGLNLSLDPDEYHKRNKNFIIPPFRVNSYAIAHQAFQAGPHPELYKKLKSLRDHICQKKDLPIYLVAGSKTLEEIARYLPQSLVELRKISGFGETKVEQYGQQFLDVVLQYCENNNLESLIHEKAPKKEKAKKEVSVKTDTKFETFNLYRQGMSITDIAKKRNLTTSTIEGHLVAFIHSGEIDIKDLLSIQKIEKITEVIKDWDKVSMKPLKEKLGDDYGYGEIRMVLSHLDSSH